MNIDDNNSINDNINIDDDSNMNNDDALQYALLNYLNSHAAVDFHLHDSVEPTHDSVEPTHVSVQPTHDSVESTEFDLDDLDPYELDELDELDESVESGRQMFNYSNGEGENLFDVEDFDFLDQPMQNEPMQNEQKKDDDKKEGENDKSFDDEQEAEQTITTAFNVMKEQFGVDTARDIIIKSALAAEIGLFKSKPREGGVGAITTINIDETRAKIERFRAATLDTNITLKPTDSIDNILDNCVVVSQQLISVEAAKEISQVRCFAYFHKLHENIEAAKANDPNFKDFLSKLKTKLELKSAAQVSKLRRKAKRVNELVDTVGNVPGAYVLGMYITVHCLENEKDENWKQMIAAIVDNTEYLAFTLTLTLGIDGVTPLLLTGL